MTAGDRPAVIELGAGWREPAAGDAPARWAGLRPAGLALAGLLALVLGGDAPVPVRLTQVGQVTLQTRILDTGLAVVEDVVLVPDEGRLAAYELRDGSLRWQVPQPTDPYQLYVRSVAAPGMVVVETAAAGRVSTWALDLADGSLRWQLPDGGVEVVGEVAVEYPRVSPDVKPAPAGDATPAGADVPVAEYVVRDLRTGRQLWTLRGEPVAAVDRATATGWTVSATGTATVRDLRDGRVLRSATLPLPEGLPFSAQVSGGLLTVRTVTADGTNHEARFETATFAPVDEAAPGYDRRDCGPRWCALSGADGVPYAIPVLIDKETGAEVARLPADSSVVPTRAGLLVSVYGRDTFTDGSRLAMLVDPVTGAPLRELDGWRHRGPEEVPAFLTRQVAGGRLQLARLGPGEVRLVAELPFPVHECAFAPQTVVCLHDGNKLTFWRLGE